MNRRIGWRLHTLLTSEERDSLEAHLIMGPEMLVTALKVKGLNGLVRDTRRVIFGTARGNQVTYKNYAGNEDTIPAERLLWNFFPGTLDERGGLIPSVIDVCWTANIVVILVKVNAVRSLLVTDGNIETEINVKASSRTIEEVLNDGDYMDPIGKVLKPVSDELATALMMKR